MVDCIHIYQNVIYRYIGKLLNFRFSLCFHSMEMGKALVSYTHKHGMPGKKRKTRRYITKHTHFKSVYMCDKSYTNACI